MVATTGDMHRCVETRCRWSLWAKFAGEVDSESRLKCTAQLYVSTLSRFLSLAVPLTNNFPHTRCCLSSMSWSLVTTQGPCSPRFADGPGGVQLEKMETRMKSTAVEDGGGARAAAVTVVLMPEKKTPRTTGEAQDQGACWGQHFLVCMGVVAFQV